MTKLETTRLRDGPLTTKSIEMFDPVDHPPPSGNLLVITRGGVLVKGPWTPDCLCWMPHPKIPESVKARQRLSQQKEENHG